MLTLGNDGLPIGRTKTNYHNQNGVLHKRCTHCGKFFRLNYFYPLKYRRNGKEYETLQSWCKFCMVAQNSKRIRMKKSNILQ